MSAKMYNESVIRHARRVQTPSRMSVKPTVSQLDRASTTIASPEPSPYVVAPGRGGDDDESEELSGSTYSSVRGTQGIGGSVHSRNNDIVRAYSGMAEPKTSVHEERTSAEKTSSTRIAYEMIQGSLVRFSSHNGMENGRHPPTAVLIHGILGSRRNMQSFAKRLVEGYPSWQVLLVDLRCHGQSANQFHGHGPHTVDSAAGDVLQLLASLKLFPEMLIGHSFGGKVAMSMAHQFGSSTKSLPRPVQVWVLDALPGEVRSGEMGQRDRPADLITTLVSTPLPIPDRAYLISCLDRAGFSAPVAAWTASNLTPVDPNDKSQGLTWAFDLHGIAEMYRSYESKSLWEFLERPAEGIRLDFVKAERSTFRWGGQDEERIKSLGHKVHLLENSGHWVHTDNPNGLFDILSSSFGAEADLHMQRSPGSSPSVSRRASWN